MWQKHLPGLLVQLLISRPLWYNIRSFKTFYINWYQIVSGNYSILMCYCGISLVALKYYHNFLAFGKTVLHCLIDMGLIHVLLINAGTHGIPLMYWTLLPPPTTPPWYTEHTLYMMALQLPKWFAGATRRRTPRKNCASPDWLSTHCGLSQNLSLPCNAKFLNYQLPVIK